MEASTSVEDTSFTLKRRNEHRWIQLPNNRLERTALSSADELER